MSGKRKYPRRNHTQIHSHRDHERRLQHHPGRSLFLHVCGGTSLPREKSGRVKYYIVCTFQESPFDSPRKIFKKHHVHVRGYCCVKLATCSVGDS